MPGTAATPPPNVSSTQLAELRRLAFRFSARDLARTVAALGIPTDLVPLKVAAEVAHCTTNYIHQLIRNGKIPSWRVGNRHLVSLSRIITKW